MSFAGEDVDYYRIGENMTREITPVDADIAMNVRIVKVEKVKGMVNVKAGAFFYIKSEKEFVRTTRNSCRCAGSQEKRIGAIPAIDLCLA